MPVTASSLINTFTIIARGFIHKIIQRYHLDREVSTITSQKCKSTSVSLTAVPISGQVRNRTRDSMKIPSTSNPPDPISHVCSLTAELISQNLLIGQYRYLKSCSGDFILQNLILRTRSCVTVFITQSGWAFHFHQTTLVWWK